MRGRLSLLVAIAACGGSRAPTEWAPIPPEIDAMPEDPDAPKLREAGAEPRAELRYRPKAGGKRTLELEVQTTDVLTGGTVEHPRWKVTATVEIMTVDHGVFSARVRYGPSEVFDDNEVTRQLAMDRLAPLEGTLALGKWTDQGQRLDFDPTSTTSKAATAVLIGINGYGTGDLPKLPADPVGRGARWTVPVWSGPGVLVPATADLELVEASDARVHLRGTVTVDETGNAVTVRGTGSIDVVQDLQTLTGTTTLHLEVTATDANGTETRSIEELRVTAR